MKTITESLVPEINAAHARFMEVGDDAGEKLIAYVNLGREVGLLLNTLKASEPQWMQLTLLDGGRGNDDIPRLAFNADTAKAFLRLPERMPQPATTVKEAMSAVKDVMMLQGALPFPQGHGPQQLHDRDSLSVIIRHVMEVQAVWHKELKDGALKSWNPERKQHARDQIQPAKQAIDSLWEDLAA